MKAYYLYFFFILFLYNCTGKVNDQPDNLTIISLTDLSFDHSLKLSNFVASMEAIPLETTQECLIGEIRNIISCNGRYYMKITNGYTNSRILVFDRQGKFLYKIDKVGVGSEEYIDMGDFIVTPQSEIKVLAYGKVVTYDSVGNYMAESSMPYYANKAVALSDSSYLIQHTTLNPEQRNILALFDSEDKEKALFFNTSPVEVTKLHYFSNLNVFSKCKEQLYFKYRFCDTIFSIENQMATPAFLLDFGKYKADYTDVVPEDNVLKIEKKVSRKDYVGVWGFQVFPNYLMFDLAFKEKLGLCFYSLKTGQSVNGFQIIDDMYLKNSVIPLKYEIFPHIISDGHLLWPIPASVILKSYNQSKAKMSSDEWIQFKSQHPKVITLCENLSEEDNPVLMRVKMKD